MLVDWLTAVIAFPMEPDQDRRLTWLSTAPLRMGGAFAALLVWAAIPLSAMAESTFLQRSARMSASVRAGTREAQQGPILPAGTRIDVRLLDSVVGDRAASGTRVRALVIAPVSVNGRLALEAGDTVAGTVVDAGAEHGRGQRYYVALSFDQLIPAKGDAVPLEARVADVPNARETVDTAGRIVGPERPGLLRSRSTWAALLLGTVDPLAGAVFFAAFRGASVERHRRIAYERGVELTLRLTAELRLPAWPEALPLQDVPAEVIAMLADTPLRAVTAKDRRPADVFTIALLGAEVEVAAAFHAAGWTEPARSSVRADYETLAAAAHARGFAAQPVSSLELDGAPPRLVFEKVVNSMVRRHHLRIWPWGEPLAGRQLWLVAATRDDGILFSRARHVFTHRVDPDIDAERLKIVNDLLTAGAVESQSYFARTPPSEPVLVNDGTTPIISDWRVAVLVLRGRS